MKITFSKTELQDFAKFCVALKLHPEDISEATVDVWEQNRGRGADIYIPPTGTSNEPATTWEKYNNWADNR